MGGVAWPDMVDAIEPGRLLGAAAKRLLSPLGCKQVGRSRTWIADQRFWVILIEFQPSSFSKGSYLNVGASWLWYAKDYWSFDYGYRCEGFASFQDDHQFAAVAERLATRAAEEVRSLRKKFASLSQIAREIAPKSDARAWPVYHAAVAAGLLGNVSSAEHLFNRLAMETATTEWHKKLQIDGAELARTLPNTAKLRKAVLAIIQEVLACRKLPPDQACLDTA